MSEVKSAPGTKGAKRSVEVSKNDENNHDGDVSVLKKQKGSVRNYDQGKVKKKEELEGPEDDEIDEEDMGDEEEDLDDEEDIDEEEEEEEDLGSGSEESNPDDPPKEFKSRSFVVLKSDFKKGEEYSIWKIDGNSLLQKYIPFEHTDGTTLYKSTSVYSGWAVDHKDNYYPAPVEFKWTDKNDTVVKFLKEQIVKETDENE